MIDEARLAEGARNLLQRCGEFAPGREILLVCEPPELGWYDAAAPDAVTKEAARLGLKTKRIEVGPPAEKLSADATLAIDGHKHAIFFARIGDQDRFAEVPAGQTKVMCYIRDAKMLASDFGTASHRAMLTFKKAVDEILLSAEEIEITCPLGTHVTGRVSDSARANPADVGVRRFPMAVPQPVEACEFDGKVALARYLTPTGSQAYDPPAVEIASLVFAEVAKGRIRRFSGDPESLSQVEAHYERVSGLFDIDPNFVHSWHAGIHPGCAYERPASADPDCWSNTAFCNPRVLHFHTCGAYAPGEICWMVLDHTVRVDGTALWENGRLCPGRFAQTQACLEAWPELVPLFENPVLEVGV